MKHNYTIRLEISLVWIHQLIILSIIYDFLAKTINTMMAIKEYIANNVIIKSILWGETILLHYLSHKDYKESLSIDRNCHRMFQDVT